MFLVITVTAFISCVLSLQAAGSRLLYSFGRDRMLPGSRWLAHLPERHAVPVNALIVVSVVPMLICLYVFWRPDNLARVTAFAVCGIYISFQAVVLAALRQRLRGWRPAGLWNLSNWGLVVNVAALAYGVFAIYLLIRPGDAGDLPRPLDRRDRAAHRRRDRVALPARRAARPALRRRPRGRRDRGRPAPPADPAADTAP